MSQSTASPSIAAAIAAHRFGLGESSIAPIASDPRGWLLAQIGPADPARGEGLLTTPQALALVAAEREKRRLAKTSAADPAAMRSDVAASQRNDVAAKARKPGATDDTMWGMQPGAQAAPSPAAQAIIGHYRESALADARSRFVTAATTTRPLMERFQLFWTNHFTVSLAKGSVRGLVGSFERDAVRPHIAGRFEDLLFASTTHPAMLRYLDNSQSAGPDSRVVAMAARRADRAGQPARVTGINENLAREVLELHTLGAESNRSTGSGSSTTGGYTQADVTSFARLLTGWRVNAETVESGAVFDPAWHEPGPKTVLGKTYAEGPDALRQVLHDIALHPATARFVATKLARHVVADDPPPALVEQLTLAYRRSDGRLDEVYRALVESPEAWSPRSMKLKTPEEFVLSGVRVLGAGAGLAGADPGSGSGRKDRPFADAGAAIYALGQRIQAAPSPAGWSDRADDWLGPDAVWKRVEWATRTADRLGTRIDARALAAQSFGDALGADTRLQLERAADGSQALALLLMAPEFQRR